MRRFLFALLFLTTSCFAGNLVNPFRFAHFVPGAAQFNGTTQYLTLTASTPTGLADGKVFSFSCWVKITGGNGTNRTVFWLDNGSNASRLRVIIDATNKLNVYALNAAGSAILDVSGSTTWTVDSTWHHISGCFDLSNSSLRKLYVGTSAETLTVTTYTDDTIDLVGTNVHYRVGARFAVTDFWVGSLGEFWFDDSYLDSPGTFESGGLPISLGATGTGAVFYFHAWDGTNTGTGGAFTVTAGPLTADTIP